MLEQVVAQVWARTPVDGRERRAIAQVLDTVDRLCSPFDEHTDLTHVTASAIVVGPRGVVLHRHKIFGTWVAPGGHIDPGETPWDAALREAAEETGLPVQFSGGAPMLVHVDVHQGPHDHTHLDLRYLLDGGVEDPTPPRNESQDVAWFSLDEATRITEPCLRGIVRHLAATRR